ncbi:hypothetical protein [Salinirubrum litoreum]|uniref:SipW-cognate class signal peptide n=1 Tax=Salinirubrum litoreum TaxID=1126234 RepID=A0ABD5RA26_9EURY|nr:hypothetical protein [Salinirubrum litoreum]
MTFDGISRRELLAGLTGVGAAGALTGLGTGALLSDTEGLAAGLAGGALDLEVTWSYPSGASESDANLARVPTTEAGTESTVSITVDLPQGATDFNNAAFVWVRLLCPEESDVPADDVTVELAYDDGDLDGQSIVGPASLADLLSLETGDGARTGVPLRATADDACLDTRDDGDPIRLALRIALDEDYVGETAFHLPVEFVGHQCRHATATENPFARSPVGPCGSVGVFEEPASDPEEPKAPEESTTESDSASTETETDPTPESSETESTPEESTPDEATPESSTAETETPTAEQSTTEQQPTEQQSTETTATESTPESVDPNVGGGRA